MHPTPRTVRTAVAALAAASALLVGGCAGGNEVEEDPGTEEQDGTGTGNGMDGDDLNGNPDGRNEDYRDDRIDVTDDPEPQS